MSTFMVLTLSFLGGFAYFSRRFMGELYLERPIVLAPIVGLLMGDLQTGLIVGGTLELIFMGAVEIGGGVTANYTIGTIIGTAFAITTGQDAQSALTIAVPAALIGSFFEVLAKTGSTFIVNAVEESIRKNKIGGITIAVHSGNLLHFLSNFIPIFLALFFGIQAVENLLNSTPDWLQNGIGVAGNLLPALGFALLLMTLVTPLLFPFFFVGFLIAAYMDVGVLGVALFGFIIAVIIQTQFKKSEDEEPFMYNPDDNDPQQTLVTKKQFRSIYWRSFAIQSAFSFDRMQAIGFTWGLLPYLKDIYKDDRPGLISAIKRHLTFFNTHPWVAGPIYASVASLEFQKSKGEEIEEEAIQGIKASLMGPVAGVGDSLFHGTLRPVVAGVCASLALQGNLIAPLLFFFSLNIVHVIVRWYTLKVGFDLGEKAMAVFASGMMKKIMEGATMAGLMATGALVAVWINVTTPASYTIEEQTISLQEKLDEILPGMLPLAVTMLIFWMLRKRMGTVPVLIIIIVAGILLGSFNILG